MLRRMVAGFLVALTAVLIPVAVGAVWAKQTVTNQDRYLEVVSAVSGVPDVRQEVRDQVVGGIVARIDPGTLTAAVVERAVARAVDRVLDDERFGDFWLGLNRVVHAQVTGVLVGDSAEFELSEDGTLTMALGPVVEALAGQLEELGVTVPPGFAADESVVIVRSPELATAQSAYDALVVAAAWLPLVCVVGLCVGLLLVRRRAEALLVAGLVTAGVGVALILALRALVASLDHVVAQEVGVTLLGSLEPWLWTTAAIAVLVAFGAGITKAVRRHARRA